MPVPISYNRLRDKPAAGGGDVTGPSSATTGHLATFADETGKLLEDGGAVPGGGGGGLAEWDSETEYSAGQTVLDRGGIWKATGTNDDSRPVSGNTDWELVGGTPYVDIGPFGPVELTSLPFYDPNTEGPGVIAIPAPGENLIVVPKYIVSYVSEGDDWADKGRANPVYGLPVDGYSVIPTGSNVPDGLDGGSGYPVWHFVVITDDDGDGLVTDDSEDIVNQPVAIYTSNDITNGGATFGTRSIKYRIYYKIIPFLNTFENSFFHITSVDQGAKTITVNGDAHTLTGSISVVGSTGNNGTYTIVSATFDTDHTDIVVSEAIPDSTADGWVKQ